MTTINVKEIEELSARLRQVNANDTLPNNAANALDALLAFYKKSVEQEPVAWQSKSGHLAYDKKSFMPSTRELSKPLYARPPASAARIEELEDRLQAAQAIINHATHMEKLDKTRIEELESVAARLNAGNTALMGENNDLSVELKEQAEKLRIASEYLSIWRSCLLGSLETTPEGRAELVKFNEVITALGEE